MAGRPDLQELHRECMSALRAYIEVAGRSCQLLDEITSFPVSVKQTAAILQQRLAENEAHDRYQIARRKLFEAARWDRGSPDTTEAPAKEE